MVVLLSEKWVKARKVHACQICTHTAIRVGDKYLRSTYVYDGRVYDWVVCAECDAMTNDVWNWSSQGEEGINAETYFEWARENRDDDRAIALFERLGW